MKKSLLALAAVSSVLVAGSALASAANTNLPTFEISGQQIPAVPGYHLTSVKVQTINGLQNVAYSGLSAYKYQLLNNETPEVGEQVLMTFAQNPTTYSPYPGPSFTAVLSYQDVQQVYQNYLQNESSCVVIEGTKDQAQAMVQQPGMQCSTKMALADKLVPQANPSK